MSTFGMWASLGVSGLITSFLGYAALKNTAGEEVVPSTFYTEDKALVSYDLSKMMYCDPSQYLDQEYEN